MENKEIKTIRQHLVKGDALRISEMTGKSHSVVIKIINGIRREQPWFIEAATKYLQILGRI